MLALLDTILLGDSTGSGRISPVPEDGAPPPAFSNTQSLSFDGVDGTAVQIPFNAPAFGQLNNVSVFCRFNTTAHGANQGTMFSHYLVTGNRRKWWLGLNSGRLRAIVSEQGFASGNTKIWESVATYNDGNWHTFGFTFASNVLKMWIEGLEIAAIDMTKLVDGAVNTLFNNTVEDVLIGSIWFPTATLSVGFDGLVEEPAWFDKELTAAEVLEWHNGGFVFPHTGFSAVANLKAFYDVEGDSLPTITDKIVSNDGTAVGGVALSATTPPV